MNIICKVYNAKKGPRTVAIPLCREKGKEKAKNANRGARAPVELTSKREVLEGKGVLNQSLNPK